ncbi:MAG: biotin/lipoyl-binding protein [Lachnospiraceae bacterium]|nr:biotin/lipoyl-binding protein [Lachnospiraceae bacterium]
MMLKRFMRNASVYMLVLSMAISGTALAGCGQKQSETEESQVELIDPVGSTETYATVERRDMKTYTQLNGKVVPTVYEYSFPTDQNFSTYANLPGNTVSKGDALVNASTEKLDEEVKSVRESISELKESYNEDMEEYNERLAVAKAAEKYWGDIAKNIEGWTEEEIAAYNKTAGEYDTGSCIYNYVKAVAERENLEQDIKERTDNYELDLAHYNTRLNRLAINREDVVVSSKIDGKVVGIRFFDMNEWVSRDVPVAAVGDFTDMVVKTDYIITSDVKRAIEVFGFSNGKRYEVEFVEPEANATITSVADAKSTFRISDPAGELKAGDYVLILIVNKQSLDTLTVPNEALNKDEEGSFVYVNNGEGNVKRQVKTGIKAGMYTEILTGLSEGEQVLADIKTTDKTKTATLTRGSVSTDFSATGYLFYSNQQYVRNPIEWGTAYVKEVNVKRNQRVEKGQVIATIWVTADDLSIRRKERTILRANEDLQELIKGGEEKNKRQIKAKREYIAELNKQVSEMKSDAAKTEIVAPYDGIITDVRNFEEGDILLKNAWVAIISKEDNCYVVVEDKSGQLTCGNEADISYKDGSGQSVVSKGSVVTVSSWAISDELKNDYTLIQVSSEDLKRMAESNIGADGWWTRTSFSVKASVREVKDVVLVPKSAVTVVDGITYVTVEENGVKTVKSFMAGGSDSTNYWVIEGLSEGTKICLE